MNRPEIPASRFRNAVLMFESFVEIDREIAAQVVGRDSFFYVFLWHQYLFLLLYFYVLTSSPALI